MDRGLGSILLFPKFSLPRLIFQGLCEAHLGGERRSNGEGAALWRGAGGRADCVHCLPPPCASMIWEPALLIETRWVCCRLEASQKSILSVHPGPRLPERGWGKWGCGGFFLLGLGERVLSPFPTLPTSGLQTFLLAQEGRQWGAGWLRTSPSLRLGGQQPPPHPPTASSVNSTPPPPLQ